MFIHRRVYDIITSRLATRPGVVLLGPRQVGKTTLAKELAATVPAGIVYLDLERPQDIRRLDDPDAFLRANPDRLCVIDEIQRLPQLFPILRGIIDERRRTGDIAGHFLLLGSASLELMQQTSETLGGRISYLELSPFDAIEISTVGRIDDLWNRGGFPESFLSQNDTLSLTWRQDFIRSYLEREIPLFAPRMPAPTVGRLWTMLAHMQGASMHASRLAVNLGVSANAITRYVDLLVDLLLVRRLQSWTADVSKRLVRTPKMYIRDSGLVHALLDIENLNQLLGHPIIGMSWEGFVIENLIIASGEKRRPFFYRTEDGSEIDLLLERGGEIEFAIEIKRSTAPQVSKGFHLACDSLKPKHAIVVHGGTEQWPMRKGVQALSLSAAMEMLAA